MEKKLKKSIEKQIEFKIAVKTHIWTAFLLTSGGTITLLLNLNSKLKIILFLIGICLSILLIYSYFKQDDQIENLINKLEKE